MSVVVALACPVCGGPVSNSSEQCEFCGSYIFIKSDLPKLSPANLNRKMIQDQINELRRRYRSNSHDEEAKYGLGVAYYSLGLLSDATRELTEASVLTPENPHIHSQLAVVLRDRFREGDSTTLPSMRERIRTALKLDPDHLEGLSLLYALQVSDGQSENARQTISKLRALSPERARKVQIETLTRRARARLDRNDWIAASREIRDLESVDNAEAKNLLIEHVRNLRLGFPLAFVSPETAKTIENRHVYAYGAAVVLAILPFVADGISFGFGAFLLLIAIYLAVRGPRTIANHALDDSVVYESNIATNSAHFHTLITLMNELERARNQEVIPLVIDFER